MASRKKSEIKTGKFAIKLTQKQLKSVARAIRQAAEERQKSAIEKLLGEDFDTLTQAKRELKRDTVQVKRTSKTAIRETKAFAKVFRDAFAGITKTENRRTISPRTTKPNAGAVGQSTKKKTSIRQTKTTQPISKQPKSSASAIPPSSKQPTLKTPKKSITFRSLKPRKGESLLQLLDRLEAMGDQAKGLLKPGERFIFTYANGRSKRAYVDIDLAVRKMREYELSKSILNGKYDDEEETEADLVSSIGFIKTTESFATYEERRHRETMERKAERRRLNAEADRRLKQAGIITKKFGGSIDRVSGLLELQRRQDEVTAKQVLLKQGVKSRRKSS